MFELGFGSFSCGTGGVLASSNPLYDMAGRSSYQTQFVVLWTLFAVIVLLNFIALAIYRAGQDGLSSSLSSVCRRTYVACTLTSFAAAD